MQRTKYYKDNPDRVAVRNAARLLGMRIAGTARQVDWLELSVDQRKGYLHLARQMLDLGADFATAERNEKTDRRGFVYVITNPAWPDHCKVGRAFNPESRLKGYQTGSPHRDYEIVHEVYFHDCYTAEGEIHARIGQYIGTHAEGEWFKCDPLWAADQINQLRETI